MFQRRNRLKPKAVSLSPLDIDVSVLFWEREKSSVSSALAAIVCDYSSVFVVRGL